MFAKPFAEAVRRAEENNPPAEGDFTGEDGLRYCGICRQPKQARIRMPECMGGKPGLVPVMCRCVSDRAEAERQEERRREHDLIRQRVFGGGREGEHTFGTDDGADPRLTQICRAYAENFTPESDWLLLYGECDAGKSFMAAAIANYLIDRDVSVVFTSVSEIQSRLWSSSDRQGLMSRLKSCGLLVLDDLFSERDTDYMSEIRYEVIDGRYRCGRRAVITTNLSTNEFRCPRDTARGRVISRLYENSLPVVCRSAGRRKRRMETSARDRLAALMR